MTLTTDQPTRERDVDDQPRTSAPPCAVCGDASKVAREGVHYCPAHSPVLMSPDGTPTAAGWRVIGERLRQEMPKKQRQGKGGMVFSYINARQVQARLDAVIGPGNWASDWQCLRAEHPVAVRVGIGIYGVWKWDAGYSNNPDADDETDKAFEDEPLKAAVSDGFKRAAVQWGIGRFLYP